jgi:hypothetical protein
MRGAMPDDSISDKSRSEEPEIIVDDDWKQQVWKEKERLARQDKKATPPRAVDMPEPSFGLLVTMLSTQALSALGVIPDAESQQPSVDTAVAKHFIDLLGMLEQKTKGNLSEPESLLVAETLHQLRLLFISSSQSIAATPTASPERQSSIELP